MSCPIRRRTQARHGGAPALEGLPGGVGAPDPASVCAFTSEPSSFSGPPATPGTKTWSSCASAWSRRTSSSGSATPIRTVYAARGAHPATCAAAHSRAVNGAHAASERRPNARADPRARTRALATSEPCAHAATLPGSFADTHFSTDFHTDCAANFSSVAFPTLRPTPAPTSGPSPVPSPKPSPEPAL